MNNIRPLNRAIEPTQRELEIAQCIADGFTTGQIARMLFLSPNTVKTHISRLFHLAKVNSRAELVAYCFRRGHIQ